MQALAVLVGLVVLGIPVAVIYLLVSYGRLRDRVAQLEAALAAARPVAEQADAPPPKPSPPKPEPVDNPWVERPAAPPKPAPAPSQVRVAATGLVTWLMGNWFYAVSAVSLALAGLFLVQYGVENDLFPPTARVIAALGFGAALIGAGDYIRRRFGDAPDQVTAYLPSVFSGAGLVSLFGGIAAAHLLYGLVGAGVAFGGLALVGLLGVGLGWLHGPLLVTVGVLGAVAAPFVVGSDVPATPWLFVYFAVITALGLGIDTVRRWAWVSVLSLVLGYGAGWITAQAGGVAMTLGAQAYAVVLVALAVLIPARGLIPDHAGTMVSRALVARLWIWPEFPTLLAAGAVTLSSVGLVWTANAGAEAFWAAVAGLTLMTVALTLWSVRARALQDLGAVPAVSLIATVLIEGQTRGLVASAYAATYAETVEAAAPIAVTLLCALGIGLSLLSAGRAMRPGASLGWTLGAALFAPVLALALELSWTPAETIGAYPWALHAMGIAAVMVGLALRFARIDGAERNRVALFVLSALSAISFAFALILTAAALTLALAVTVLVAALLDRRFDLELMQVFILAGVAAVGTRLVADPGLSWALDAPLVSVIVAYGGALAAFGAALWAAGTRPRPAAEVVLGTAAWSLGGLLASILLFRALEAALGVDGSFSHWGFGLYAVIWLGLMLVQLVRLQRLGGVMAWVRGALACVFGLIGALALAVGLTVLSPLVADWGRPVAGPALLNTLAVAYALPGALLVAGAWRLRPGILRLGLMGAGVAVLAYWAFAALRHLWQGAAGMPLDTGFLQPELYSYTVALLIVGAALFYQSLARGAVGLRRAGLVVIGLAVAKVFLIDISGLDGLTRVLSLVVLGLSLAGLAWLNRWAQARG